MKKLLVSLAAMTTAAVLMSAPTSSAQPGASTGADRAESSSEQGVAARRQPLKKWKCTKWGGSSASYQRTCVRILSVHDKIKIDYRERFYNEGPQWGTLKCSHTKTTTWTFNVTASVEAEAGVIFAKAKTSISAGVARSSSTTRTTEVTYRHKPKTWAHCERGIHGYTFSGQVRKDNCSSRGCKRTTKDFTATAPEAGFWRYGGGRGGAEVK